jgi:adenosylcobinamide-GDP ribazoletransferase
MQQIRLFFIALQFYTRIPTPRWVGWQPEWLSQSARYFSVVGALVGSLSAAVWWLSVQLLTPSIAATLAVIAAVLTTGAFHEDGLADVCDGLGAGGTPERMLDIMKDSRVGAYGAIGITMALLLRVQLLAAMTPHLGVVLLICGHTVSRVLAIALPLRHAYVGNSDRAAGEHSSKAKPAVMGLARQDIAWCALWGAALCGLCNWAVGLPFGTLGIALSAGLLASAFTAWRMGVYFQARLGGITGDCLGAVQQVCDCVLTASALATLTAITR